jgi:hypothetical protein
MIETINSSFVFKVVLLEFLSEDSTEVAIISCADKIRDNIILLATGLISIKLTKIYFTFGRWNPVSGLHYR